MQYISILDLLQLRNGVGRKMLSIFSLYHTDERKAVAVRRMETQKPVSMIAYSEHKGGGRGGVDLKVQVLQLK